MTYYSIGQFSKLIGKSIQTLRLWDNTGVLKPHHITVGGHRYYSEQQMNEVLQMNTPKKVKKIIGYCRVSSNKQRDDLDRQVENVKTYMLSRGYSFEIITDIGSGINYDKKGLNHLIDISRNTIAAHHPLFLSHPLFTACSATKFYHFTSVPVSAHHLFFIKSLKVCWKNLVLNKVLLNIDLLLA